MRIIMFLLVPCLACAGGQIRELPPSPSWVNTTEVDSKGPDVVSLNMGHLPDVVRAKFRSALDSQVAKSHFASGGAVHTVLLALSAIDRTSMQGSVLMDGHEVEPLHVEIGSLPCYSMWWGDTDINAHNYACFAAEAVRNLIESKAVAAAASLSVSRRENASYTAVNAGLTLGASDLSASSHPKRVLSGKLAVLELRNFATELSRENAQYFTDVIRQAALRLAPQLDVMTRENLVVLLQSSGKRIEECEGECEVDTGRRIGADEIVSGEIQKLGSSFKLSLRLHDTHEGKLLASAIASGKSIDDLDIGASKAVEDLFLGH